MGDPWRELGVLGWGGGRSLQLVKKKTKILKISELGIEIINFKDFHGERRVYARKRAINF